MADAFRLGKDAKIYRNSGSRLSPTWVEVSIVKENTLNLEKGEFDGSTRGTGGWRAKAGTLKDASIELEVMHKPTDAAVIAFMDAFLAGTNIEMQIMDGDRTVQGNEGLHADMQVMSMSRAEPLEEGIVWSITVTPGISDDPPVWYRVP